MPVHTNTIGTEKFDNLTGPIDLRQQLLRVINRAGVDGSAIQRQGNKAQQYILTSLYYVKDFATAKTKLEAYKALAAAAPQVVVKHSVNYGSFQVIRVDEAQDPTAVFSVAGSVWEIDNPGEKPECLHIVRWTLLG